jgi:hypothetical protein
VEPDRTCNFGVSVCVLRDLASVAADLVLLVRSVMARWLPLRDAEAANVCCSVCKLVAGISSRLQGEFKADTVLVLVSFFQAVIKSASSGVLLKEEGSPHIFKATTEALNSLGYGSNCWICHPFQY